MEKNIEPNREPNIKANLIKEKNQNFAYEIFPLIEKENKNKYNKIIRRITDFNFTSLIKDKVIEKIKHFINIENFEDYGIHNFDSIFKNKKIQNLSKFENLERIKLDPVMITNLSDNSDIEFYWGEWNSLGKKEGFGIKLSSYGNFYFGTFKDDKMDGLGIYAFADKGENEENISKEINFKKNYFYIKQFSDLEKRSKNRKINNNDKGKGNNLDKDNPLKNFIRNYFDNKINYFLFIGEFDKNKFHGIGDIFHSTIEGYRFSGKFSSNKISEGKFNM